MEEGPEALDSPYQMLYFQARWEIQRVANYKNFGTELEGKNGSGSLRLEEPDCLSQIPGLAQRNHQWKTENR